MFYPPEDFRKFTRLLIIFGMVLLLALGALSSFQLYANYAPYIYQAGLQTTREEVIANAMLTLEYRPQSEHANAVAKIATALPGFIKEQNFLQTNTAEDTRTLVLQSQPSFLAIASAAQTVMNNPNKAIDPVEVSVVMNNRDAYRMGINLVVQLLVQHSEEYIFNMWLVETGIVVILMGLGIFYTLVMERRMKHVIAEEKAKEKPPAITNKLPEQNETA